MGEGVLQRAPPSSGGWKPQDCINNPKLQNSPYCKRISKCTFGDRACQAGCNHKTLGGAESVQKKNPPPSGGWKAQDCRVDLGWQHMGYCLCLAKCAHGDRACQAGCNHSTLNRGLNDVTPFKSMNRNGPPPSHGWKSQDCANPKWQKMPFCKCLAKCKHGNLACQGSCNLSTGNRQLDYVAPVNAVERSVSKTLAKGPNSFEKAQQTLEKGQQIVEKGPKPLEKGPKTLAGVPKPLAKVPKPLVKDQKTLEKGQKTLEKGQKTLEKSQKALGKGPKPVAKAAKPSAKSPKKGKKAFGKGPKEPVSQNREKKDMSQSGLSTTI